MKEIRKILLFLLGSALLGALLAPWLFWGGKWLATRTHWQFLADAEFAKFFDRSVLIGKIDQRDIETRLRLHTCSSRPCASVER